MLATREEVRSGLLVFMSRTGWGPREISDRAGYAYATVMQFLSNGRFGTGQEGGETVQRLARFLAENHPRLPEFPPGRFYETEATRAMRELLGEAREGVWGTLYGPAGAQKTWLFRTIYAESAREPIPWVAMVTVPDRRMQPRALLAQIAQAIGAPYSYRSTHLRDGILYELERRKASVAVIIDEAQRLYPMLDTLECLRGLGDLADGRLGIVVAGNEEVVSLFEARRSSSMEQWRSRIEQRELRVLGPGESEARPIVESELGRAAAPVVDYVISKAVVTDPLPPRKRYVNMRRLFNAIRDYRREKARTSRKVN